MFFTKKIPKIEERWSVKTGEYNGKPIFIRFNNGLETIKGKGILNLRSGISFRLLKETENGLPSSEENPKLNELDDKVNEVFNNLKNVVVAVVISTNGFREYVIYYDKYCDFETNFNNLKTLFPDYELTAYTVEDKKWKVYKQYE